MDLTQRKLTKAEWNSIEVPVSVQEKRIGDLIQSGYEDVNIRRNYTLSLLKYMKIAYSNVNDTYIYSKYLQPDLLLLAKKYELVLDTIDVSSIKMKKADIIRFSNTDKQLSDQKGNIYEFIIIDFLCKLYDLKNPKATKSSSSSSSSKKYLLIVVDGTWTQAKRMLRNSPVLLERCQLYIWNNIQSRSGIWKSSWRRKNVRLF